MVTVDQISDTLLIANAYFVQLLDQDTASLQVGLPPINNRLVKLLKRLIRSLQWDVDFNNVDEDTEALYTQLLNKLYLYDGAGITVDPSVIIPGKTIVVNNAGSVVNMRDYIFSNATDLEVLNYQTSLKPLFGPNPEISIFVVNVDGSFSEDLATAVNKVYSIPGDSTSDLVSFNFQYGQATSGYYQLTGVQP